MGIKERFYIGSYTDMSWSRGSAGEGLYHAELDIETGSISCCGVTGGLINPSFSVFDKSQSHLYVVNEVEPVNKNAEGRIATFSVDKESGQLELLGETSSFGLSPCYITLDGREENAFITNYCGDCVASINIDQHRVLRELVQKVFHHGSGPDKERQEGPHPHSVIFDRDDKRIVVADLGIDKLIVYDVAYDGGRPQMKFASEASVAPGYGPRHTLFSRNGKRLYVLCEMGSRIYVFDYDTKSGGLQYRQDLSTLPENIPENCCAHLQLSPDENYLYASNRGHDSIAIFRVCKGDGTLEYLQTQPAGGKTPRHFSIDPTGRFLITANQDSDLVCCFRRDFNTGFLTQVSQVVIPSPVHIAFL